MGQTDTISCFDLLITEDSEYGKEILARLTKGCCVWAAPKKVWKIHSILLARKMRLVKIYVWPAAMNDRENWTTTKNDKARIYSL